MSTEFFNDQWRMPNNKNQSLISNYSMDFDGTNTKIDFGDVNNFEITNSFSGSCWVNLQLGSSSQYLISKQLGSGTYRGYAFSLKTDDTLQFGLIDSFNSSEIIVSSSETIASNTWYHLAFTYDGSNSGSGVKMYIDGTPTTNTISSVGTITTILNTTDFQVSGRGGGNGNIVGKIDQTCIFGYELSQDQVTQLGAEGYAFNFIPNDRINVGNDSSLNITGALTLSIWMKSTSTAVQGVFSKNGNTAGTKIFALYTGVASGNDILYSWVSNDGSTLSSTNITLSGRQITDGNWHNIVMVNDPTTTNNYLYVDGVEVHTTTNGTTIHSSTVDTLIGTYSSSSYHFNGELSNAQIFNSVIPPTGSNSVQTIYNNGKPLAGMSSFTSLQGWWKLDDTATFNSGTSVWSIPDDSSNSNTGASVGMNASNLVASNINGELISNPMALSPKPIAYYQLGDQSVDNGANYLVPNNSLSDYVFDFDGTDDSIDLGLIPPFNTAFTKLSISLWAKTTTWANSNFTLLNNRPNPQDGTGFALNTYSTNLYLYGAGFASAVNIPFSSSGFVDGTWNHILITIDTTEPISSDRLKFYINGGDAIEKNGGLGPYANGTTNLLIGDGLRGNFEGQLSQICFFDYVLSSAQAATIYNNGAPNDISSLSPTAWYKLNAADTFNSSTSTWTIKDYAGSNDGTSSGMTSSNLVQSDLQHTSGYSPYALTLDSNDANQLPLNNGGNAILNGATSFTVSAWINPTDTGLTQAIFTNWAIGGNIMIRFSTSEAIETFYNGLSLSSLSTGSSVITFGEWQHIVVTYSGSEIKIYRNNVLLSTGSATGTLVSATGTDLIGNRPATNQFFNGKMSNVAIWKNSVIVVNTLYNQGVPADLTSLSPTGWWQLGSNSSFNSGVWTCLNQGTGSTSAVPANATSTATMTNDDITNGPGYSANGLGSSSIDIVGDAPYSTANGLSENMDVLDRTIDVPG